MKAKEYVEKRLDPSTEKYSLHDRKKITSFSGYDLEEAFEEGQKNPTWNTEGLPEPFVTVIADDIYLGLVFAHVDSDEEWRSESSDSPLNVDRWSPLPV